MLKVNVRKLGNVVVLSLQGQIVNGETEMLRNAVVDLHETNAVILDFAQVATVDAHGLGVMLELREQLQANGMRFALMNVSKQLLRVLEITRLDTVFQITSGADRFPAVARHARTLVAGLKSCA